jgi:hypothetical protein
LTLGVAVSFSPLLENPFFEGSLLGHTTTIGHNGNITVVPQSTLSCGKGKENRFKRTKEDN